MPNTKLMTGRDLGKAICAHFGLNANLVQSDYQIKTDPGELASVTLTVLLTADDLAGIARAAGADDGGASTFTIKAGPDVAAERARLGDILRCYGLGSHAATQELKIKVDTSGLDDLVERMERYAQKHYGCAAALEPGEMIQGEALALEPDPRLNEIVTLLKRIEARLCGPIETVHVVPGA